MPCGARNSIWSINSVATNSASSPDRAFGVSTWERQPPQTVVDPEALIVMTLVAGDIRLIHETLDWGVQARKLVSTTRLRRLGALTGTSEQVDEWLGLVGTGSGTRNEPVELSGKSRRRGALIPPVPATLALRLRSFTGPTTRSDIVRALHPVLLDEVDAIDSTTLVHEVVASRNQVIDALEELIAAGLVLRIGSERRRRYLPSLEDEFARAFWSGWRTAGYASWRSAADIVPGMLRALHHLDSPQAATSVTTAMDTYETTSDVLVRLRGSGLPALPPGTRSELAPILSDRLAAALADVAGYLDGAPVVVADPDSAPLASPWSGGTWLRPRRS